MRATYLDHMGTDLTVVNAARVSFNKRSEELNGKDIKLIEYLAREHHWLPFRHPNVQFHCKAPIFVARQAVKHQVGMSWSEVSRRYVSSKPEYWWPEGWRLRADNVKQGSSSEKIYRFKSNNEHILHEVAFLQAITDNLYEELLDHNVAPELARIILPHNMYTEWVWTGSLLSWAHFVKQRTEEHAQQEIREFAETFVPDLERLFPHSWTALMENYTP